jgi:hypothetical protein
MAVVGKKANRFFSRRMAELNEARTKGAATRDLHPELVASIGKEVTERHEISEEIKLQAKDAEDLRESLKGIYKSALPIGQTLTPFADSVRAHNKTVQAFADHLEPGNSTDALRQAMSHTVRLQECLLAGLEEMTKGLDALVVQPQQAFVKKDIRDARYFAHEFLKAQVDYEGSVSRLNQVMQKSKVDAKKYQQSLAEMGQFRGKFDQVAVDAQTKFAHMHEVNATDNAAHQLQYLNLLRGIFARGMALCDEFASSVQQSQQEVEARRGDREANGTGIPTMPHTAGAFESTNSLASPTDATAAAAAAPSGKPMTLENVYNDVVDLLARPDGLVVRSVWTLAPEEERAPLVQSVSRVLQQTNTFTVYLGRVLEAELAAGEPVAASADGAPVWHVRHVFEHEPTAALVADFFRAHGVSYAKNVLQPTLRALAKEAKALELHPKKVAGEELAANADRLKKYVRETAEAIFESSVISPLSVRQLCQSLLQEATAVEARHGNKRDPKADVASLLFFHLFLPAISRPDEYGLLTADQLTPAAKRNVYLLSLAMRGVAKRSKADPNSGEEWFLGPVDDAVMAASDNLIAYVATMCGEGAAVEAASAPQSFDDKYPVSLRQQDLDPFVQRLDRNLLQLTPAFSQAGATDLVLSVGHLVQAHQAITQNRGIVPVREPILAAADKSAPASWNDDD